MRKILLIRIIVSYLFFSYCPSINGQEAEYLQKKADTILQSSNFELAHELYFKALNLAEKEKNYYIKAKAERGIGACNYYLHDPQKAHKWFYQYLNTVNQYKIDPLKSDALYTVGVIYIEQNNLDSVKKYIYPALTLMEKEKDFPRLSRVYSVLAELHINKTKNTALIEKYLSNAMAYGDSCGIGDIKLFALMKHYNYYYRVKKDYKNAINYINQAEELALKSKNRDNLTNIYRHKAECLIQLKDTCALGYIRKWFAYKDSVFDAEKTKALAQYEKLYEVEKKESENMRLIQDNKIKDLSLKNRRNTIYLLGLILVILIFISLWRINKINIKRKEQQILFFKQLQKEKERIARDLHDNVGGQLSYLITNLEWIAQHPEKFEDKNLLNQKLLEYSQTGRNAMLSLREAIWAVNNEELNIIDFCDRFKNYILKLNVDTIKVEFEEKFINTQNKLLPEQALHLFRICQEAFHNALKHSKCNLIKIHFESNYECLIKITIEDNGIGFNTNINKNGHYGLENMKKRAEEALAELTLKSEKDKGTKITICVKHNHANAVLAGKI
jgi:signal transduction histidine kinase